MCSGSAAGSYSRLVDFVYDLTLGVRVTKNERKNTSGDGLARVGREESGRGRDLDGGARGDHSGRDMPVEQGPNGGLGGDRPRHDPCSGFAFRVDSQTILGMAWTVCVGMDPPTLTGGPNRFGPPVWVGGRCAWHSDRALSRCTVDGSYMKCVSI